MIAILLAIAAALLLVLLAIGKVPLTYNVRNLTVRWKTTLMTSMAFTLVIALLIWMLAFVNGMRRLTEGTGRPGNVIVLAESSTDEAFSNLNTGDLSEIENQPAVVRGDNGRPLASRETYLVVNQPMANPRPGRPKRRFLQVRGIADPLLAAAVHELRLVPGGNWFSAAGVRTVPGTGADRAPTVIEAVLGEGVARELAFDRTPEQAAAASNPQRLDLGEMFTLGNRMWIVVGVMESSGSTFNSEIWAKQSLIAPIFGKETFTTLVLRTKDAQTATEFKDFLNAKSGDASQGGSNAIYKKASVAAQVETEYYASLSDTNKQFLFAIGFVTVVIAIGGAFGVMNTMLAAVNQRIKDIGVLQLLGFSRQEILISFLLESLLIALVGGLLGCLLGLFADGWTASSVVTGHQGGGKFVVLKLVVDAQSIATGILLTLAMGVVGGLAPSFSAMRLRALEALR